MQPLLPCDETPCRRIRVLVVDGHAAVRHAVATFVGAFDDMELAGEAANGEEALDLCDCRHPDVVLMAINMTGLSAAATTRTIRKCWPAIRVIGMSTFQEEEQVSEVLRAGAVDYLLKNVSADELAHSIRRAYHA